MTAPRSLAELAAWLEAAPDGVMIPASTLRQLVANLADASAPAAPDPASGDTWRERIWTVPAETRLGVEEMVEAIGRPKSWIYRHTSTKSGLPLLPCRKLDGVLVFVAGEVRAWLKTHEELVADPTAPATRPVLTLNTARPRSRSTKA